VVRRDTITPEEVRVLTAQPARSKYGNRTTFVPELNRSFSSQHEAEVAVGLWRRQQAGQIRALAFQVPYDLIVEGEARSMVVARYVADFTYLERGADGVWRLVVADAKGFATPLYKLKKKLMKACLGLTVEEL
jgi:hypothetical protein